MDTQANMNDQGLIDPDLEPQTRPRSCTWPMNRPNVNVQGQQNMPQDNGMSMKMEATIAECSSQEQLMADDYIAPNAFTMIKEEIKAEPFGVMSPSAFPTADFPPGVIGSPTNLVSDLSNILLSPTLTSTSPDGTGGPTNFVSSSLVTSPFVATTQNITSSERGPNVTHKLTDVAATTSASVTSSDTTSVTSPSTVATKPKTSSRKNAWGNMSYADLITQGIESSPDKRLTLAQIYDWMVKNVPYFKDKGDSNSSAGWKNSIRHNLSLHSKFKRIQNEGTGKSSWWVINYDAKPGKSPRRRATSMDTSNSKFRRAQSKASSANKKELLKKEKAMKRDSPTGPTDFEHLNKSLTSDFRQRTSSNASSIGGRISPRQGYLTQDLEDDGPPPLSPLSSSFTPSSAFDLFGGGHDFGLSDCLDTNGPTDALQGELLDSIRTGMSLINPSSPLGPGPGSSNACTTANDRTNIYLNNIGASSQSQVDPASTASSNRTVLSSPNLASLLQQGSGQSNTSSMVMNPASVKSAVGVDLGSSQPRARSNTMPGQLHAQHKYNIPGKMQRLQGSESLSQECLFTPFKETGATLSSSPQNVYRNKVNPYGGYVGGPRNAQQEPSLRRNAQAPAGMSLYSNDRKTLCQLLTQEQTNNKLVTQNQPLLTQTHSVGSARPNQLQASRDRQGPSQISDMQMHDYQAQYKDLLPQAQRVGNMGGMAPIPQDIPQGINMDQDFFDPGALDFDLMLKNIDDPVTDDFDWFQPHERTAIGLPGAMEMEQSMDTGNMCDSYKVMGSNEVIFQQQYNPNLMTMSNMNMPQRRQPPPQYNPHQQELYQDNTAFADGNSGMLLDVNSQMNGGALMGGSRVPNNMASLSFAPQYVQPRQTLQPQSSVPSIGHYRM